MYGFEKGLYEFYNFIFFEYNKLIVLKVKEKCLEMIVFWMFCILVWMISYKFYVKKYVC